MEGYSYMTENKCFMKMGGRESENMNENLHISTKKTKSLLSCKAASERKLADWNKVHEDLEEGDHC